ncbi:hypothetical protein N7517_004072 [Penicillium concentricum]|uniref:F-box domain-containing protein n=1 Tax=Penicillium concentricum TaxID=293559 RepID=A0A9W9S4V2_9EURO|nr:uncharacterized protein N7517_004072 [Penicillium concentricum]KAJ5372066.1 hypothetical protein N7517_004072 [Penicillium concentricum]
MAMKLPLELLIQIANILQGEGAPLAPCASVCRIWQMAFEPLIYFKLDVYSDDEHKQEDQSGISLTKFQDLTSGNRAIRQSWVRDLHYDILVPFDILDWRTCKQTEPKGKVYSTRNTIREANNLAF